MAAETINIKARNTLDQEEKKFFNQMEVLYKSVQEILLLDHGNQFAKFPEIGSKFVYGFYMQFAKLYLHLDVGLKYGSIEQQKYEQLALEMEKLSGRVRGSKRNNTPNRLMTL